MNRQLNKYYLITKPADTIPQVILKSSKDVYGYCKLIHELEGNDIQEFFYVLFLNRANRITGYYLASMGGITGTVADPRLILKTALLNDCTSIVLCHNHPSGSIKPSKADEDLTQKIKTACNYVDITVLDHIILGDTCFYSFADEGII